MTSVLFNGGKATDRFALAQAVAALAGPNDPKRDRAASLASAASHQNSYQSAVKVFQGYAGAGSVAHR